MITTPSVAVSRIARLYDEGVLPVDRLSLESAVASYRSGKVPFVTVLEALNTLYADSAIYLSRLADAEKWRVAIDEGDLQSTAGMAGGASASAGPSGISASGAAMGAAPSMK